MTRGRQSAPLLGVMNGDNNPLVEGQEDKARTLTEEAGTTQGTGSDAGTEGTTTQDGETKDGEGEPPLSVAGDLDAPPPTDSPTRGIEQTDIDQARQTGGIATTPDDSPEKPGDIPGDNGDGQRTDNVTIMDTDADPKPDPAPEDVEELLGYLHRHPDEAQDILGTHWDGTYAGVDKAARAFLQSVADRPAEDPGWPKGRLAIELAQSTEERRADEEDPEAAKKRAQEDFLAHFPRFGNWFDAVQKWAQFEGRPIPEINQQWEDAYAAFEGPQTAAERLCLPKP